jgi:hypothetical protein
MVREQIEGELEGIRRQIADIKNNMIIRGGARNDDPHDPTVLRLHSELTLAREQEKILASALERLDSNSSRLGFGNTPTA